MPAVVEAYYSPTMLAALVGMSERFIRDVIKRGEFGPGAVFLISGEYRIKASAANAWLAKHEFPAPALARSEGELRRKLAA